jgi:hypothetical protein
MQFQTSSTRNLIETGIAAISFVLLWLSFLTFPGPQALEIDASWQLVLAHAVQQHWQAGVDYIFTYGPLGYFALNNPNYEANLFYQAVLWGMISSFCLSSIFLACWYNLPQKLEKFLYLGLLIIVIPEVSHFSDAWYFLGMMGTTLLLLQPPPFLTVSTRYWVATGVALLGFALLSLTKFNLLILAVACVTGIILVAGHRHSRKTAALLLISFIVMFIGIWLSCQQSLGNLPTFLATSWQLTSYYTEAMSLPPNSTAVVWLALSTMSITSLLVISNSLTKPLELAKFIAGGIILLGLFLSWKAGFVRYSSYHTITFFCTAMIVPFLIQRTAPLSLRRSFLFSSLLVINVAIATAGAFYVAGSYSNYTVGNFIGSWYKQVTGNTQRLLLLSEYKQVCDQLTAQLRQGYELPKIRARVGNATVDMFPPGQSIIFYNALNYHPRPVFQGYVAYTESLLKINGNYYANPQTAPQFIIFGLSPIDNHFPMMEDSKALQVILRDYQPLFVERGLLLLERSPRAVTIFPPKPPQSPALVERLLTKEMKLGETLNLQQFSARNLFMSLDIRSSLLGRLSSLLFQLPPLFLEITTIDGMVLNYRLIPSIANTDFLLNPLLLNQADWLKWYHGQPLKRVAAVRVLVSEDLQHLFLPMVTVKVTASGISPYQIKP